jgi:hypothetical protein
MQDVYETASSAGERRRLSRDLESLPDGVTVAMAVQGSAGTWTGLGGQMDGDIDDALGSIFGEMACRYLLEQVNEV